MFMDVKTHHFGHVLGEIRDVEISGTTITLRLEAGVERFLGKLAAVTNGQEIRKRTRAKPTS